MTRSTGRICRTFSWLVTCCVVDLVVSTGLLLGAERVGQVAGQSLPERSNSIGMKLVLIPEGEFMMGGQESAEHLAEAFPTYHRTPEYFQDEYPRHRVRITKPFYFGKYEVTVGQFRQFVDATGYKTEPERDGTGGWGYDPAVGKCGGRDPKFSWRNPGFPQTDNHPVLNVTWADAVAFCQWLSGKEGRTYRLPTEAEWEYACRAGTSTRYHNGDDPGGLAAVAKVVDTQKHPVFGHVQEIEIAGNEPDAFTAPVGGRQPNPWGLYDMHGNAWEWCSDWYGADYYAKSPVDDPPRPDSGIRRVRRGGGWNSFPLWARAAFRNWNRPNSRCVNLGFRIVQNIGFLSDLDIPFNPRGYDPVSSGPYAAWPNGPDKAPDYFPIAVWLQDPKNAARYKAIGVNLYMALWKGPTAAQLAELKRQGMAVICEQNDYAKAHLDDKTIVGWMHGDEPDNAQELPGGKSYGPPILPDRIVADYRKLRSVDPSRPVILNLGQGVAWDGWYGRGVRTNHPEDYRQYVLGGDIVSFDIYPAVHDKPAIAGKLWYVARGVDRLRNWGQGGKIVWDCIECTRIGNPHVKPAPAQVKAEVWMSIIHGSQGIVYFCHQFQPRFIEAALLADDEMARAVGAINRQIRGLAAVINSSEPNLPVRVRCSPPEIAADRAAAFPGDGIALAVRQHRGATYLFTVRMEPKPAEATFNLPGQSDRETVEVLGEGRSIEAKAGRFEDHFDGYAVHLYQVAGRH